MAALHTRLKKLESELEHSRAESAFARGQVLRRDEQLKDERRHYLEELLRIREIVSSYGLHPDHVMASMPQMDRQGSSLNLDENEQKTEAQLAAQAELKV